MTDGYPFELASAIFVVLFIVVGIDNLCNGVCNAHFSTAKEMAVVNLTWAAAEELNESFEIKCRFTQMENRRICRKSRGRGLDK